MGTYTQPAIIKAPDMTAGLKAARGATQSILKGVEISNKKKAAKAATEAKDKDKFTIKKYKGIKDIEMNINDGGRFSTQSVDDKQKAFFTPMINNLYRESNPTKYEAEEKRILGMSKDVSMLVQYWNSTGDVVDGMFGPAGTNGVRTMKNSTAPGANLNSNDAIDLDAGVDYRMFGGSHLTFYEKGDDYGLKYEYPIVNGEVTNWQAFGKTTEGKKIADKVEAHNTNILNQASRNNQTPNIADFLTVEKVYKEQVENAQATGNTSYAFGLGSKEYTARGINANVAGAGKILAAYDAKTYQTFRKQQWDLHGASYYKKFDKTKGAKITEFETTTDSGVRTNKVVDFEQTNEAIKSRYLSNMWQIPLTENSYQGLGFKDDFDPNDASQRYDAVIKMAENDIEQFGKDAVSSTDYSQDASQANYAKLTSAIPGFGQNFSLPKRSTNSTGQTTYTNVDASLPLNDAVASGEIKPKMVNGVQVAYGSEEAFKAGYSLEDYKNIAAYYGKGYMNRSGSDQLNNFGALLSTMPGLSNQGVSFQGGDELRNNYLGNTKLQRDFINDSGGLVAGQNETVFFKWLSGESQTVNGVDIDGCQSPVAGVGNIDEQKIYKNSGQYVQGFVMESPYAALELMLRASNVSNANRIKLLSNSGASTTATTSKTVIQNKPKNKAAINDPLSTKYRGKTNPTTNKAYVWDGIKWV